MLRPGVNKFKRPAILAVMAAGYSTMLLANRIDLEIISSIIFVSTLIFVLFRASSDAFDGTSAKIDAVEVASTVFGIALGLLVPVLIAGKAAEFFWAVDSMTTHIPKATAIAAWLTGESPFPFHDAINSQGGLTQFFIGLLFWIFGETPAASVLGLAVFRTLTGIVLIRICRETFQSKKYDIVFLFYALYPNALFHTTAYFKEALIHLLIALTLLLLARIARGIDRKTLSFIDVPLLSVVFAMLYIERFYLVLLFLPILIVVISYGALKRSLLFSTAIAVLLASVVALHPYFKFSISEFQLRIQEMREIHKAFPGINIQVNYDIPIWLAFIKSLLTPIWSPAKIEVFRGFSALITWGSFLGHIIILGYVLGVYRAIRKLGWSHFWIQIPFVLFLVAIAYVSPWAGRIRDSFVPLIVVYSTYYFVSFFWQDWKRIRNLIKSRNE